MKKIIIGILLFLNVLVYSDKIRVAVLEFTAKGEAINEAYLADAIVEHLMTALINTQQFRVVERQDLNKVMRELNLQNSDDFNEDLRKQLGKLYGAQLVVLGSLTKIGTRYSINVRGVNVETGEAEFAQSLETTSKEMLIDLVPKIVDLISGRKSRTDVEAELKLKQEEEKKKEEERLKEEKRKQNKALYTRNAKNAIAINLYIWGLSSLALMVPSTVLGYYYLNPEEYYKLIPEITDPAERLKLRTSVGFAALGCTIAMALCLIPTIICFSLLGFVRVVMNYYKASDKYTSLNKKVMNIDFNIALEKDKMLCYFVIW
ncbi:MAG: hypothetical protein JXB50_00420 [Spirochaetes bacterium]|nr:hypothetical protein [Spirochaetota bacterium]